MFSSSARSASHRMRTREICARSGRKNGLLLSFVISSSDGSDWAQEASPNALHAILNFVKRASRISHFCNAPRSSSAVTGGAPALHDDGEEQPAGKKSSAAGVSAGGPGACMRMGGEVELL